MNTTKALKGEAMSDRLAEIEKCKGWPDDIEWLIDRVKELEAENRQQKILLDTYRMLERGND
jgi:hypothetical protein